MILMVDWEKSTWTRNRKTLLSQVTVESLVVVDISNLNLPQQLDPTDNDSNGRLGKINVDPQLQDSLIPGGCGEPGGCGHLSAEPPAGGPHGQEQLEHGALLPLHEGGQVRPEPLHV
jgi:hypothetical protein